jgi:hypothetical protein
MSEEQVQETNDGTWSGLKKTIVGTLGTVVAGGGVWLSTLLFGGGVDDKAEPVQQQAVPNIIINNTQQQQQAPAGKTVVIKEQSAKPSEAPKPKPKNDDWTKEEPKW